jgi:hypothetical protein
MYLLPSSDWKKIAVLPEPVKPTVGQRFGELSIRVLEQELPNKGSRSSRASRSWSPISECSTSISRVDSPYILRCNSISQAEKGSSGRHCIVGAAKGQS